MSFFKSQDLSFSTQWRWVPLLGYHVLAAFILLTWFIDPVQSLWAYVDELIFFTLNGSLAAGGWWSKTVSYANTRVYDKYSTLFLVFILLGWAAFGWGDDLGKRLAAAIFIGLYMLIIVNLRREMEWLEYERPSPSLVHTSFVDLREQFPGMRPKTDSGSSFPGDHAISCMIFVSLFWFYAGWKAGLFALLVTPAFVMPRLIAGAHWASDAVVGATIYSLVVVAWVLFSPLGGRCCRGIYWAIKRATLLLPKPLRL